MYRTEKNRGTCAQQAHYRCLYIYISTEHEKKFIGLDELNLNAIHLSQ